MQRPEKRLAMSWRLKMRENKRIQFKDWRLDRKRSQRGA